MLLIKFFCFPSPLQTEAVFVSNRTAASRLMARSCYAGSGHAGGDDDDEIDGPEIARLMRRFWPRDLNFFGGSANASAGSRSLRDSRSSSTSAANRPMVLNLRGDQGINLPRINFSFKLIG